MSDLVKKVGGAVDTAMILWAANHDKLGARKWDVPPDIIARAAIKVVAEWLQEDPLAEMCCVAGATLLSEMESSE